MDHSEDDKRFYVYIHKNQDGDVVYVGSGSGRRYKRPTGRTKEHIAVFDTLTKEIVKQGLSKRESIELEIQLYDLYKPSGKLLNKKAPTAVLDIDWEHLDKFVYYSETSSTYLRWKVDRYAGKDYLINKYPKDSEVGCRSGNGYILVSIDGTKYLAHRVIWSILNKTNLSKGLVVDHINNNPADNNISNLRAVTASQNSSNRKNSKIIKWYESKNYWDLRVTRNGKTYSKYFTPHALFPEDSYEDSKEKSLLLAKEYLSLIYSDLHGSARTLEIDALLDKSWKLSASKLKNKSTFEYGISFEKQGNYGRYRVRVVEDGKKVTKNFNYKKLFPDLPPEEAKSKALELAIQFRDSNKD